MERLHVNIQGFCIFYRNTWKSMAGLAGAIIAQYSWDWFRALSDTEVCRCSSAGYKMV